ncbi:MAG: transcriptional regulator with XRE-family HTH domain [Rickettsiales bacterium]|jgi:transcriptional regulator with XRE-family HTH domain
MSETSKKESNLKFGEFIKKIRLKQNIGLREFAREIDVSGAYIAKIESGNSSIPQEEVIKKMAKILKMDEDKLLSIANKISSDIKDIINDKPDLYASFLRRAKPKDLERFIKEMDDDKK